jgi:hypothetical protein
MISLSVLKTTIFKRQPIQSALLSQTDKATIAAGKVFELSAYVLEGDHFKITLKHQADWINGRNTWYVFALHVQLNLPQKAIATPSDIRLKVPYFNQVDNQFEPMRTCNTSACAMVAKFLGASISGDDAYYQIVRRYGDTTDHSAQTAALEAIGIVSTWHTNLGFADLDRSLAAGLPIVIGILHRGTEQNPSGGHMVVVIGKNSVGYIVHDPFGSLLDAYTGAVSNGNGVVYSRQVLERRWLVEGARSGWGRLFVKPAA